MHSYTGTARGHTANNSMTMATRRSQVLAIVIVCSILISYFSFMLGDEASLTATYVGQNADNTKLVKSDLKHVEQIKRLSAEETYSGASAVKYDDNTLRFAESCKSKDVVTSFIMTKIEKTGSSTLFNIFSRFTLKNKLNVLMQRLNYHIDWLSTKGKGWDIGPTNHNMADVLINHARYNQFVFKQYMKREAQLIVPVREPISLFISAIKYYATYNVVKPNTSASTVLADNHLMYLRRGGILGINSWFHIPQLQWLGFDYRLRSNITAIKEHIARIVPRIDMPILNDKFDESLVVLRRRFCWSYPDIFYQASEVAKGEKFTLSEKEKILLLSAERNLGDKLLYDAVVAKWWNQPEIQHSDFWTEVVYFKQLNKDLTSIHCGQVLRSNNTMVIPATHWHKDIHVTFDLCTNLYKTKWTMVEELGHYALGDRFRVS